MAQGFNNDIKLLINFNALATLHKVVVHKHDTGGEGGVVKQYTIDILDFCRIATMYCGEFTSAWMKKTSRIISHAYVQSST